MKHITWVMILLFYRNFIDGYVKRKVLLKTLEQCRNADDLPMVLSNFIVYQETKGNYLLRGNIAIKKDLPRNWTAKVEMYKCSDGYNPDSCEIYLDNLRTKSGCEIMEQLFIYYKDIFKSITPKLDCPMRAGTYTLEKCPINDHMKYLLSHGSVSSVVVRAEGFHRDEPLFCFESRFDLTDRRFNVTDKN